jgi:hypothetical protein
MRIRSLALCVVVFVFAAYAQAASETGTIVYRPLGNMWPCREPYTFSVMLTGRAVFSGAKCLCEPGVREIQIEKSVVESWFSRLVTAQFLTLPYNISPGPEDSSRYELELITKSGTNRIAFSRSFPSIPREVFQVFLEIERHIDPGWVRFWGKQCGPSKSESKGFT